MFSNVSVNSLSETNHTVIVRASNAIFPGTYTGELTLYVCADENCNQPLQAPQTTTYEVTYKPDDIVMRVVGEGYTTHQDFIDGYSFNVFSVLPLGETTTQASFEVEIYLPDDNASYSFSQEMIDTFNITNQSTTGFTFTTPSSPAGDNQYPLEISLSDAGQTDITIDYDVYPVDFEIFEYHALAQTTKITLADGDSAEVAIQVYSPSDMTTTLHEKSDCGFWFNLDTFDATLPGFGIHSINARVNTAFEMAGTQKICTLVLRDAAGDDIIEFDYTLTIN